MSNPKIISKMSEIPKNYIFTAYNQMKNIKQKKEKIEYSDDEEEIFKDIILIINGKITIIKRSNPIPIPAKIHNQD